MPYEIERKFLVYKDKLPELPEGYELKQGYIPTKNNSTVRVRIRNNRAVITLKSPRKNISRLEFEHPIPKDEAEEIIHELCEDAYIDKTRHYINYEGHLWEIDVFHGANEGLIVAEVELESEEEPFDKPEWAAEEVSLDPKYRNSRLLQNPFCDWEIEK